MNSAPIPSKPLRDYEPARHVTQWERGYPCGCREHVSEHYTETLFFCDLHRQAVLDLLELW